jgi:hypothetical protein
MRIQLPTEQVDSIEINGLTPTQVQQLAGPAMQLMRVLGTRDMHIRPFVTTTQGHRFKLVDAPDDGAPEEKPE